MNRVLRALLPFLEFPAEFDPRSAFVNTVVKAVLLEAWFLVLFPLLGWGLRSAFGYLGSLLWLGLFVSWCWQLFAFVHYRMCRQEEFLQVLSTAAALKAPIESVLRAYLRDRPGGGLYRFWVACLLCFVFPGYYWIHRQRYFDARMAWVLHLLDRGVPLDYALIAVPGVVSRQTGLALTVGHFTGQLADALQHLPSRRQAPRWLELVPRLLYPLFLVLVMMAMAVFVGVFIIPKFEKLFLDFQVTIPLATHILIETTRWGYKFGWLLPFGWLLLLFLINVELFSSYAKWYSPIIGRLYRMQARGQFLQVLGTMLETGKPLPAILDRTLQSTLLPRVLEKRVHRLAEDVQQGTRLEDSLAAHGLVTKSMRSLIVAAAKTQTLPWALRELGETLQQRSSRICHRLTMAVFPLAIFGCACLIAFMALAMFMPLLTMMEKANG